MRLPLRSKALFVALAIIATATSSGLAASPAAAYCNANISGGNAVAVSISQSWGKEGPRSTPTATCSDGDTIYSGKIWDLSSDGHYVQVRLASSSSMSNEFVQSFTGSASNYSAWGSWWLRICKSGTSLGAPVTSSGCSGRVIHQPS